MNQSVSRFLCLGLICAILFGSVPIASARYNSSGYRRFVQQQQKVNQQAMQMQQKMMMAEMARLAAIEKKKKEMISAASKARHDKEEQHRQDMIAKRKAENATRSTETPDAKK